MFLDKLKELDGLFVEYLKLSKQKGAPITDAIEKVLETRKITAAAIQNYNPYQQESGEVQAAKATIADFEKDESTTSAFNHIDKATIIAALKGRIDDPEEADQDNLNLCGAATFSNVWLQRDPEGYAKAVLELYTKGKTTYNGIKIKANKKMFDQVPEGSNVLDWMLLSSLQNAGGLLGYNPDKEWGGLRGIALPGKVMKWFEKLPDTETKKYRKDRTVSQLNAEVAKGSSIIFLVNMTALDNYILGYNFPDTKFDSSVIGNLTGNHYIMLASEVKMNGGNMEFDIWTWAKEFSLSIPEKEYKKAVKKTYIVSDNDGEE